MVLLRHLTPLVALSFTVACSSSSEVGDLSLPPAPARVAPAPVAPAPPPPHALAPSAPTTGPAIAIAAGDSHTCAILESREVVCWGDDAEGQLGTGTMGIASVTPVRVRGVPPSAAPIELAAGGSHTCLRTADGAVWCWGANDSGELGDGVPIAQLDHGIASATPTVVGGLGHATAISAGAAHTCALVDDPAPGTTPVRCWGSQRHGLLGNGFASSTGLSTPTAVVFNDGSLFPSPPIAISSHLETNVVVLGDGTSWWWGAGDFGAPAAAMATFPLPFAAITGAWFATAGGGTACALGVASASLRCFGGDDHVEESAEAVGLGRDRACALVDGDVRCWSAHQATSDRVVFDVAGDVTRLAVGSAHACAIRRGGRVWCWDLTSLVPTLVLPSVSNNP